MAIGLAPQFAQSAVGVTNNVTIDASDLINSISTSWTATNFSGNDTMKGGAGNDQIGRRGWK